MTNSFDILCRIASMYNLPVSFTTREGVPSTHLYCDAMRRSQYPYWLTIGNVMCEGGDSLEVCCGRMVQRVLQDRFREISRA